MQIAGLVGKGGKEREVLLPADLAARLRAFRGDGVGAGPVFTGPPSTQRRGENRPAGALSVQAVGQILEKAAQRAPLPQRVKDGVSPHWLRHAHASSARQRRADFARAANTRSRFNQNDQHLRARQARRQFWALFEGGALMSERF